MRIFEFYELGISKNITFKNIQKTSVNSELNFLNIFHHNTKIVPYFLKKSFEKFSEVIL